MMFQWILIAFSVFAIGKVLKQYRSQKISLHSFLIWALFWIGVVLVALRPSATDEIAELVGVERGADLIVYLSIVFLFYAVYRLLGRMEEQRREITKLTREIAVREAKKKDS